LLEVAELAAAFRGTAELALESSQQGAACVMTLSQVWSDPLLVWLTETLRERQVSHAMAVVLGLRSARQDLPLCLSLPAFLQSYTTNLVTAGVRLIPLGQTDGQLAIAALEQTALLAAEQVEKATIEDLGSAGFMVDLASMAHETQYTRLFRS
jgi:urease accessory protein